MSEGDDGFIITLPLPPRWMPWANIGSQILFALVQAGHAVLIIWFWRSMARAFRFILPSEFSLVLIEYILFTVLTGLFAAHSLMMHLRWGQVPKQLKVTADNMSLSWLGFRGMRERRWTRAAVRSIDVKIVKDAFTRRMIYRVRIQFCRRWNAALLLPTSDLDLAEQIRARLCARHLRNNNSSL